MNLSIVIPTLNRFNELDLLLQSIVDCDLNTNFEVLVINQNSEGYLEALELKYNKILNIKFCNVDFKGASKARNYGANLSNGEYICFPDDDCKILKDTFNKSLKLLEEEQLDVVYGKCVDEKGANSVINFKNYEYFLNTKNMLGGFVEATLVCKRELFDKFVFDENMGVGTFFGAEEGFDWLYRILIDEANYKVMYSPEIKFYHPQVILSKGDLSALNRVFKYRCGTAYLCHKHHFAGKYYKRLIMAYAASKLYYFTDKEKSKYYKTEFLALQLGKIFAEKYL